MKHSHGFTLIEILIAMAIMAIALTALSGNSSVITHNNARLQDKTVALWIAQDVLNQYRISNQWPSAGNSQGENSQLGQNWPWKVNVGNSSASNVFKINISVFSPASPDAPAANLNSFFTRYTRSPKLFSSTP